MERRNFLSSVVKSSLVLPAFKQSFKLQDLNLSKNITIEPTPAQKHWMSLKYGLFIHFGINTYYDAEWSDGTLNPDKFNPTEIDTDQWCRVAKAAGLKYIIFVTKHHDGFCNWATKATKYSVKATPFKKDLLKMVVDSARKYGLEVGLYYSLWDRHEPLHDKDEVKYIDFMKSQLAELLTNYGPIIEIWFDGFWKKQQSGWKNPQAIEGEKVDGQLKNEAFIDAWRREGAYRWQMDHLYQFIKDLQPNCLVANNSTTAYPGLPLHPVDIRPGEKATKLKQDTKVWNWLGKDRYLPLQIETTLSNKGNKQFPSGNWFWHESDHSIVSKAEVQNYMRIAEQFGANLVLNVGPMANGKLRPEDEQLLLSLKA